MKKIKSKYIKTLAILLSMAMLMTGLPASIYAEKIATPTDTVEVLETVETTVKGNFEQPSNTLLKGSEQVEEETLPPDEPKQTETPSGEMPDEPIQEDDPADESDTVEEPTVDLNEGSEERPAIEDDPSEPLPEDELTEEVIIDEHPVKAAIDANGYAYLMTDHSIRAFSAADMWEHCFTIEPDSILLVTAFIEQDGLNILEVQFLTPSGDLMVAYVYADDLSDILLTGTDIDTAALTTNFALVFVGDDKLAVFAVNGGTSDKIVENQPVGEIPEETEQSDEMPPVEDIPAVEQLDEPEQPTDEQPEITDQPKQSEIPSEELSAETAELPEQTDETEQQSEEVLFLEDIPPVKDETAAEIPLEDYIPASEGAFVLVTTDTSVFLAVDDSAAYDYEGDLNLGVFVHDAAVQVEAVEQDNMGRYWYRVRYLYGDTHADGTLKWTDYDTIYVLAEETLETGAQDYDVTDFAFPYAPKAMSTFSLRATPMHSFSLRDSSASMGNFYVGQSGLYGDSGKDSEYLQIATLAGHGKIYATPHYLEGYIVYCLEHLLPGPGERISGGGYQSTGPYTVVDLASYMNTPGYSGVQYKESTMHAIGWVLRHTVPFMELDESYSDNRIWSRVAGQFAIREVIKQLEGAQYVRDYWNMDDFYAASNNAPAVYLEYARWLAENGIARAHMTGDVNVSNKSVTSSGGMTIGTVTLTTDADLIRISKSYGAVSGYTYGEDNAYYYLNNGDTITISSSASSFSFTAESVSSPEEEAGFVVGIPYEPIQKLLIPIEGLPYPLKAVTVSFDIPYGSVSVTKTDAETGKVLAGATFDLISGSTLIQSMTTGADGVVTFTNVPPGTYTIRESTAPEGYMLGSVNVQTVNVSNGQTSRVTFANEKITARIKIIKKDSLTDDKLAGAVFKITRLSGPAVVSGMAIGESITIVTDVNGEITTGWLEWGRYRIEETAAPEGFLLSDYSTEVDAYENGKTYAFEVGNEPMPGYIQLQKTDRLDGRPISGVTFDIYHNDQYGSEFAGSMTTDENGVAVSPPLRKGDYLVVEQESPTGYVAEMIELPAVVYSDETTELSVTNEPIQGVLRIRKLDGLTGELLSGAEFTITRISGLPSHNGEGDGEVVAVITTDAHGVAVTPLLTYGLYRVDETKVPPHFVDNSFSTEMVIDEENFCTYETTVENEPAKGWLRLTKTDCENGNPIAGVVFDVYYADQYGRGLATTMVTDENGVAMSEPLRKGKYIVQERGATKGYVFEQVFLEATVHSDEITDLAATNQPVLVRLKLHKRDKDEYSGNPADAPGTRGDGVLTGAEFQVRAAEDIADRQGNVIHAKGDVVIDSIKTAGADASITTDTLWPGLYQVVELTPPIGYQSTDKPITMDTRDAAKQSEEAIITYEGVITNEIKYGAQAIVKLLGDGTPAADPTRVETPEPGAEFRVYLQKAGSYDNARDIERDSLVTDENGYAMTKALPYGVYVLEQVKGKEGYEIKGPILFEIDGTESLVNPPPLTLSDHPILYRLKLIKTDSVTGKTITLSNASFKLKDADGNYVNQKVYYPREQVIDIFTTDDTGSVTLPETITWGLYFVEEVKAPEGYLLRTEPLSIFVGHKGDQPGQTYELEIEIPNDPVMGRILLDKKGLQLTDVKISTDAWGNEVHSPVYEEGYLAGAVFEIHAAEDITGKDGTVWYQAGELVDTITTTANGGDASKELPLGKYNVIEVSAPEGYFFTDRAYVVDLRYKDDQTALVEVRLTVENDFLPAEISLFKEKETISIVTSGKGSVKSILTNEAGKGFVFGLFTAEDIPYAYGTLMVDTLVATGATDKNGTLTLVGTFPHGDYYIRELHTPAGWKITADRFDLSITPDRKADDKNVLRVLMADAIHNELIHTKVTLTKTDITGEKTLPGAIIEVCNEAGKIIYRDTTNELGRIANIPVTPGRYTFREVYAPDGYAFNDVTMSFTVSEDGVVTSGTTIHDDYTRFSIEKLDEAERPLTGVEFSLMTTSGTVIMTARTNRDGIATFEKIPFGSYRVVETKPLTGYVPAETEVEVTIDGTFVNPEQPIATIVNVPNEIVIRKVDQDGKPLSDAAFGLFDAFGERFAVAISDENGIVRFTKIPYGNYTIRELSAPDGYLSSKEEIAVTIDADYRSSDKPVATVKNHLKRVQFIKVDTSGKFLPGVEFSLINAITHEVVETAVSNDKGEFIFTKFDYGNWIVREAEAPEGYNRMEDYLLHVDENWTEPKPITLVNIPSTYMFFKSDNRKNALAGAIFAVEDENDQVVQEVVSAENGVVYIYGLKPGKYTIRETATIEGFTVNDDTIEVVIDEKYEIPNKLKRFVNYPSISTGVDVSPTMLTWIGMGLAGAAGIIVATGSRNRKGGRCKKH